MVLCLHGNVGSVFSFPLTTDSHARAERLPGKSRASRTIILLSRLLERDQFEKNTYTSCTFTYKKLKALHPESFFLKPLLSFGKQASNRLPVMQTSIVYAMMQCGHVFIPVHSPAASLNFLHLALDIISQSRTSHIWQQESYASVSMFVSTCCYL